MTTNITQKAWFYEDYGTTDVLKLGDFPFPSPQSNQLLVQVLAAALNPIDSKLRQRPIAAAVQFPVVPGCDMAGVVVSKGNEVFDFEIGDEVYGNIQDFNQGKLNQLGTMAQFIVVDHDLVSKKPKNLTFEEAASLPLAVQTAVEGFRTSCFKEGWTVFVVGGAGGVGSLVVQLAKHVYGASKVVATTSTTKLKFVEGLGADKVVDYLKTRYEDIEERFDLVYDTIGDSENSFVLAKKGAPVIDITWPPSNPRVLYSGLTISGKILDDLHSYLLKGKLKAVIDPTGPYHFSDLVEAFRYLETGRAKGKVVILFFYFLAHLGIF